MSNAYPIIWAMKHAPVADALERLILIAMADAADSDGCNSYRSFRSHMLIAKDVDEATIRRRQRAMAERGLIRPDTTPPPARYLAIPKNRRPPRWEICVPYSWWSDAQREEIQRERQDKGLPELTPASRPDLADAPPRKRRADKGKPNPKRGRKQAPKGVDEQGGSDRGVSETPQPDDAGVSTRQPQGCLQDSPGGVSETPNLPVVPSGVTSPDPEDAEAAHTEEKTPAGLVPVDVITQAAAIASRLGLARLDAQPKQVEQITYALAEALARPDADAATVERYAAAKVAEGRTVKYLLGAFEAGRLAVGLLAYRAAMPAPRTTAAPCHAHPGARVRSDGECSGCFADRMAADASVA